MKLAIKALFGVFVSLVVIVMIAPYFIDLNSYKSQIIETAEEKTGLDIVVDGDVTLSILPMPSFSVSDVTVSEASEKNSEPNISFKRLSVNVELIPLFSGKIAVKSVSIDNPVIQVVKRKDGSINILNLLNDANNSNKNEEAAPPDTTSDKALPDVSFNVVRIKDGTFYYKDEATKTENTVRNVNLEVSAENLMGPYRADGSLFYNGHAIEFDLKTDAYDDKEKVISPQITMNIEPIGVNLVFSGAVNMLEESPALQGHVEVNLKDLSQLSKMKSADKPLKLSGVLSANETKISMSNMKGALGTNKFTGMASLDLKTLQPSVALKTIDNLNLGDFGFNALPYKTVSFDLKASGDAKSVKIDKTTVQLDKDTYVITGKYVVDTQDVDLDVQTKFIDLDRLMGYTATGTSNNSDSAATTAKPKGISASTTNAMGSIPPLPFGVDLSFSAEKVLYREKNAENVNLSLSGGNTKVEIKNLSVGNYIGTSIKGAGSTNNFNTLDQVDAYIDVNSKNAKGLLTHFGVDASALPKAVNSGGVKVKLSGNKDLMNLTANISALGGELISKGNVISVLSAPSIKELILQIKHKNMADLMNLLTGARITDRNLSKPLNLYTEINQDGNVYELTKLKGDLSGATMQGHLNVNLSGKIPSLEGALDFGELNMQSVVDSKPSSSAGGGSGSGSSASSKASTSARWSRETINAAALHSLNMDLQLKANKIQYGTWPLTKSSVRLTLKNGNLIISDLNANVFGGSMSMNANLKSVEQPRQPVHFNSESHFKNVDIGSLATSLVGTKLVKILGRGDLDLNLKSSGASSAALVHDLSGDGAVKAQNITLDGVDVVRFVRALSDESKPGDTVLGLWKGTTRGGTTRFDTLDGKFTIKQGVVNLTKMDLDGSRAAIETRGNINLPDWTLATKHKLIVKGTEDVPSDVPPFEISFSGSLDNPAQTFGQGLLQDYLNRKIQRKFNKFISDKIGVPSNDNAQKNEQEESQNQGRPKDLEDAAEDAIKGILGDLLR